MCAHVYAASSVQLSLHAAMSFTVQSVIRGYHEYKDMWIAVIGEELSCKREPTNREDRFAVAVTKDSSIVGTYLGKYQLFVPCFCGSLARSAVVSLGQDSTLVIYHKGDSKFPAR